MADHTPGADRTLREQRERTIERLCQHFAHDQLTLEELERRLDVAERTQDQGELAQLLSDLQPRTPAVVTPQPVPAPLSPPPVPMQRPDSGLVLAVMGGVERRGAWRPAANTFVLCLMGGAELDFRGVPLPPGETEVFVLALMGGLDVVVPPELAVEVNGVAIMGGFGHQVPVTAPAADAPVLRIRGLALMGGVDVSVRLPGESAKDAKRRLRKQRGAG